MEFSRDEFWSGLPFPSPGDLADSGIEPASPTLQADALSSEPPGKQRTYSYGQRLSLPERSLSAACIWRYILSSNTIPRQGTKDHPGSLCPAQSQGAPFCSWEVHNLHNGEEQPCRESLESGRNQVCTHNCYHQKALDWNLGATVCQPGESTPRAKRRSFHICKTKILHG